MGRELELSELADHIGEKVNYYVDPDEWFPSYEAPDEMVTIVEVGKGGSGWVKVVLRKEDGVNFTQLINPISKSHLWTIGGKE